MHFAMGAQKLVEGFHGMAKVDQMVLPFPYAQLLKIFSYCIVFTLPWVLAPKLVYWYGLATEVP